MLFERAYGLADADLRIPNEITMRFGIGSLTKPITAVAAMRLVERGALRLADAVCDFLRDCPAAWREVRLRHLLRARFYELTATGRKQLRAEANWWRTAAAAVDRVLGPALQEG